MERTTEPKIVFFGTPGFAVPALDALYASGVQIAAVVTQPDKPAGRGLKTEASPIKVRALELGLTVLQPLTLKDSAQLDAIKTLGAEVAIVVAYGKIIPKTVLSLFTRGVLNIHPSLLPKYRGPSPIQTAILNGDSETGVTLMLLDEVVDHGPIVASSVQHIESSTTGRELSEILARSGAKLLVEAFHKYLSGKIIPHSQNHAAATFTKILQRADGKIEWDKSAEYIERMIRAYDLWPGTWTMNSNRKRIKILKSTLLHPKIGCAGNPTPGYVWKTEDGRLTVNCNPGSVVLEGVQLEGKKAVSGPEFLHGYPKFLHTILT